MRAKKAQQALTDDVLLSARISDQLWEGMVRVDVPGLGKGVACTKFFEGALLCDFNDLLLEGDEASAHVRRSEADNTYDTSYMYMFKCNDKFGVVDSVDSDMYGKSFGRYINHSCTPNVAVKANMIDGTPTLLMYAALCEEPSICL